MEPTESAGHSTNDAPYVISLAPYKSHFTGKAGSEGLSNLPKVPELIRKRFLSGSRGCSSPFIIPRRPPKAGCTQHCLTEPLWGPNTALGAEGFSTNFNLLMLVFQPVGQLVNIPGGEYISYCVICFSQGHYTESKLRLFQTKPERQWLKSKT